MSLTELIEQGGPAAQSVLYLGVPLVAVSIVHAVAPKRWALWVGGLGAALVLAIAFSGYSKSRSQTDEAIERMSREPGAMKPSELAELRERGYLEAYRPLQFGGVLAGACVIPLVIGELRRRKKQHA